MNRLLLFAPEPKARRRGVALVIVLCLLALMAVLVVGFFTSVTTDFTTTQSYATAVDTRQLSESAVNLVMAQIAQGAVSSGSKTWTSQPGMIRTFDNGGGLGKFYKLYSSDAMIVDGASFSATAETPATGWNQEPALYTDLNSPVLVSDSYGNVTGTDGNPYTPIFPIIEGNYLVDGSKLSPAVPANKPDASATYLTYDAPVRDSTGAILKAADGVADIDGFYVESPTTYNGDSTRISGTNNPLPMAVKWLYVLQNGKIIAPATATGSSRIADFSSASVQPTAKNPIVGRIAFWTDDETSKVNINTAAGDEKLTFPVDPTSGIAFGSFWDLPRANTWNERGYNGSSSTGSYVPGLAWSQPYQAEFQRYPGHPATVALNPVFPSFSRSDIGAVIPRIQNGGSLGGSAQLQYDKTKATAVTLDSDRLYASVDELMFKPALNSGTRSLNLASITRNKLEQSKFFLTAASRAPDLNLFGRPRVTIWPISNAINGSTQDTYCTSQDKLIAFCSTIGTPGAASSKPYYFTRWNSNSSTYDYSSIPRNQELYAYLQRQTSAAIPGLNYTNGNTNNFKSKYLLDRDQILTEIFDYIRCVNLVDVNLNSMATFTKVLGSGSAGIGQALPIQITPPGSSTPTQGFGRFPTVMEAALQFYVDSVTTTVTASGTTTSPKSMKAVLLLEMFHPMLGYYSVYPYFDEVATFKNTSGGDWNVTISGATSSLAFPTSAVTNSVVAGIDAMNTRSWGADGRGLAEQFQTAGAYKSLGGTNDVTKYPFCSTTSITIPSGASSFTFSGGSVTLQIVPHGLTSPAIQTINLTFPASSSGSDWPLPKVSTGNPTQYSQTGIAPYDWRIKGLWNHGTESSTPPAHPWWSDIVDANDTVRALEAVGSTSLAGTPVAPYGDLRLVALNSDLTTGAKATYFSPHKDYTGTAQQAHSLRLSGVFPYNSYCSTGQLVSKTGAASTGVTSTTSPIITAGIYDVRGSGAFAGDFDNGIADYPDGPYANKPDEGDIRGTYTTILAPYFASNIIDQGTAYFSPNREISSGVMFGSLPTGVMAEKPWQTLLFRPDPLGTHAGSQSPKDHFLLDLFTMPIVEPYAISEPFSTAGRINLNYQIMPFGKAINRETGMRAALQSTWIMNIPYAEMASTRYKINYATDASGNSKNYRFPIDIDTTLKYLSDRFTNTVNTSYNRNFVSASEICDVDLYPASLSTGKCTNTNMTSYWADTLTGDNSRESPYNHLYPLLTTKSNTFTVHLRVQSLKQSSVGRAAAADWAKWNEDKDKVTGEYRGSTGIERYIDPNDERFTSGTLDPDTTSLDTAYKFRVISVKKFNP
ncbi:MAG: Verru_Chthon cassette protein A [Chthoniobacteraceae bacterium]